MPATYLKLGSLVLPLLGFFFFFPPPLCNLCYMQELLAVTDLGEIWDGHRRSQGCGRHGQNTGPCRTLA